MDLHRATKKADWQSVPGAERNTWQKVAAATAGVVTIGNFLSVIGLVSVPIALVAIVGNEQYFLGIVLLILGRVCDLLDGFLADKTGTKSALGEKVDATFDKLSIGLTVLVLAIGGVVAWWVVFVLALPHIIIAILAIIVFKKGQIMHPSRAGKLSMAVAWVCLPVFVAAAALQGDARTLTHAFAYILLCVSAGFGVVSTLGYIREFRQTMKKSR